MQEEEKGGVGESGEKKKEEATGDRPLIELGSLPALIHPVISCESVSHTGSKQTH